MKGPLTGIRIIDWTIWQQGPVATHDAGRPGRRGDQDRGARQGRPGPRDRRGCRRLDRQNGRNLLLRGEQPPQAEYHARSEAPEAREIVYRLAAKSDVFVQNFRKGVAERLGLDYPDLRAHNPIVSSTPAPRATARTGPTAASRRSITSAQSRSGIMHIAADRRRRADLSVRRHRRPDGRDHAVVRSDDRAASRASATASGRRSTRRIWAR